MVISAAFLIGTEEKDLACRVVLTCFELYFYSSAMRNAAVKDGEPANLQIDRFD